MIQELFDIKNNRAINICGPCSAETKGQVDKTFDDIAQFNCVDVYRAGIWKPRTRPGSFEGMGEEALPWVVNAAKRNGKPLAIEVAKPRHAELALKAGVDILWIGARTTVNPFAVQELADFLKDYPDVPVMVKNPVNPDLELWIGAIERLQTVGIKNIAAIHRGFSTYQDTGYRNDPMWEIPIEFMLRMPNIKMICDPSHICGKRDTLAGVAQQSMYLNMHGLMIETHCNPDEAWSDAAQQITPTRLNELLTDLNATKPKFSQSDNLNELAALRKKIDQIDEALIRSFADRMQIAREIAALKKQEQVSVLQMDRWKQIFEARINMAKELGLSQEFIQNVLNQIHRESIQQQNKIVEH